MPPMWKYIRVVFLLLPHILWNWPFFLAYKRHPEKYPYQERYARVRRLVLRLIRAFHVDFHIENKELFLSLQKEKNSYLLVSDHMSLLDPVFFIYLSERPISFVAKKEVKKYPLIGTILQAIDGLYLDREDLRGSVAVIRSLENNLKEDQWDYGIFPEGTRRKEPLTPSVSFHPGSFKAALLSERPVLIVAMYGTFRVLKKESWNRYPVEIRFIERISTKKEDLGEKGTVEIAAYSEAKIQETLIRFQKMDQEYEEKKLYRLRWKGGSKVR